MPDFDKNAAYIWAIVALGLATPILLSAYSHLREILARKRLQRMRGEEDAL